MNQPFELEAENANRSSVNRSIENNSAKIEQNGKSLFDTPTNAQRKAEVSANNRKRRSTKREKSDDDLFANRKPITEVLHDIYDKNIQ